MFEDDETPENLRSLFAKQKQERTDYIADLAEKGLITPKEYVNKGETIQAYGHVLDTGDGAGEALLYTADKMGKPEGWVDRVKHNAVHKNVLDATMKRLSTHPVSVSMAEKGILATHSKRSLKTAGSISSLLNALSGLVRLNKRVDNLEKAVVELAGHVVDTEDRLSDVEGKVTNLEFEMLSDKEKALHLLDNEYTVSQVCEIVGKHRNTITRWRKEE